LLWSPDHIKWYLTGLVVINFLVDEIIDINLYSFLLLNTVLVTVFIDLRTKFLFRIVSSYIFILSGIVSIQYDINNELTIAILGALFAISYRYNPIKGLGGGDIPFFIAMLPLINIWLASVALLIASTFTLGYKVLSQKQRTAFGPGIAIGMVSVLFFEDPIQSFIFY